jgi:NADH-quinone oxidoreductase subunit H
MPQALVQGILVTIGAVLLTVIVSVAVLFLIWYERKLLGRMQMRLGPYHVGPHGLLQTLADALKLLLKEDVRPASADRLVFNLAPAVVFVPTFVVFVTIPFTRDLVLRNLNLGLLFFFSVSSVSVVGMLMAGWGSINKYALFGGLRSVAQLVSYELPMAFSILAVAMLAGTLDLREVVERQTVWYLFLQPIGFVIFLLAGMAETSRIPFDIPIAESEVVGGPLIEYSGFRWSIFFLTEYAHVFAIGLLTAIMYLDGWEGPAIPGFETPFHLFWMLLKTFAVVTFIFWARAAWPRLRVDQLMAFAWKVLLPLSFLNVFLTGFYQMYGWGALIAGLAISLGAAWLWYQSRSRLRQPSPATASAAAGS